MNIIETKKKKGLNIMIEAKREKQLREIVYLGPMLAEIK